MKYFFLLLVVPLFMTTARAQEKSYEPKLSLSVDAGIPTLGKNLAFKQIMEGLFNGGITLQYNIVGGFTAGLGAKYSYFNINSFALNNADWGGGLHIPAPYLRLSYEKFTTERISLSAGLKVGYAAMISANDSCKSIKGEPHTVGALFFEPQVEALMLTGKGSSDGFSFTIGYNFYLREFNPAFICMDELPNLSEEHYDGITRFLSIGFGYRYYFGRK